MEGDTPPTLPNRRPSPPFINPILLILLIPILTLILIFLLIPSFVSLISNIITIKPGSLKKSWDSLNILLVLVAVICAILAKRNENLDQPLDISDQPVDLTANSRFRRNSSSYPDLRQVSDWDTGYRQLRYFDDFELKKYNQMKGWDVKVIPMDTFGAAKSPPACEEKQAEEQIQLRSVQKQGRKETEIEVQRGLNTHSTRVAVSQDEKRRKRRQKTRNAIKEPEKMEKTQKLFPPPTPPPPPPPPPPPSFYDIFKKKNKNKRVHSVSGSAPPPPPPPPPPPLSHIFNNMFKTGSKSKRFEKKLKKYPTAVPPPPPPPPPRSIFNNMFKTKITSKRKIKYSNYIPPPPPPPPSPYIFNNMFQTGIKIKQSEKTISRYEEEEKDENRTTGAESPAFNFPPPLPPFGITERDFVRIGSATCSSGDLEDVDLFSYDKMDGGDRLGPAMVTCPSPDVNTKADTFIARLKGEWKLEKMKSMREKQLSPRN